MGGTDPDKKVFLGMKKNHPHFARGIILSVFVSFLVYPAARTQDAGFFLDSWKEKSAVVPGFESVAKPVAVPTVTITVDMDQKMNRVPEYIFGNNAVTWDNGLPYNTTAMTDLKNLDPHVLRWPGGSLSDNYFWNVPVGQRPLDIPPGIGPWYGMDTENWQMSTDEYYALLERTNSTGSIVVNYGYARYGTGPNPVATAAHMAAQWVRYDNGRSRFWEIGNENFGSWESGYRIDPALNQDGQPEVISGQLYGEHCLVFIDSMRAAAAETGAEIKIGVVAYDEETSWDPIQTVWNEQMMPVVGDKADFLIVHSYFTPHEQNSPVSTILNSHDVPGKIMSVLVSDMAEAGKPMIPVAMTEWNIFATGSMQQVSFINGMLSALVLGEFIRNDYGLGARWDLVNGWNDGDDHAMFSTGGEPGVDPYNPRPAFFYMYYFQHYFGDRMVGSTVSGNDQVIVHASSFSTGESGMVIVNKSNVHETASVRMENFKPGARYYTHTLTGGSDNGDFSRKVFVNGIGTDEEGGGPDEYEGIRAFASEVEGGIRVGLPARSVVYLMVDKKPPLSYISSRIDTSASLIRVELSEPIFLNGDPTGVEVTANGSTLLPVAGLETDPGDPNILLVFLHQEVAPSDVLTLSYTGSSVISHDSIALAPFSGALVENRLPGAAPLLTGITTDSSGSVLRLLFNMAMQVSDAAAADSFRLEDIGIPGGILALSGVQVDGEDPKVLLLTPVDPLFAEYELTLSYAGSGIRSADDGLLESFSQLPVTNLAPGLPPGLVSAEVTGHGRSIHARFDKAMNDLSPYSSLFTVKVNQETCPVEAIASVGKEMNLSLACLIRYADEVTVSYAGTGVTAVDRGVFKAVDNYTVDNLLQEPALFEIPGVIDAELFSVTEGMVLQPCSDAGGGYNLGGVEAGDWAEYEVNVVQSGYYHGNIRVAATTNAGRLIIQTPGGSQVNLDTVSVPATGGWQRWESVPVEIALEAGRQQLRLYAQTSYFNINWLELAFNRTLQANVVSATTNLTGDTIALLFDRSMALPQEGEQAFFSVTAGGTPILVNGVFLAEDRGTTLLLVLGEKIGAVQQDITVSYEPGNLVASDGIPVASFAGIPVANQVVTSLELLPMAGISIYPNPVRDILNIEIPPMEAAFLEIRIIDVVGRTVYRQDVAYLGAHRSIQVKTDHFEKGVYLVRILRGGSSHEQTLIIR